MSGQIAELFRSSINIDAERSRVTIGGQEVSYHCEKFSTRIIKGLEDVLGIDAASTLLIKSSARATAGMLTDFLDAQGEWSSMTTDQRLNVIFEIFKVLGYGAVNLEDSDGASAVVISSSSYLAEGYLENYRQWNWPVRKTPFCHDMCGHLQAAFALANDKELEAIHVKERECRTTGAEKCFFDIEVEK